MQLLPWMSWMSRVSWVPWTTSWHWTRWAARRLVHVPGQRAWRWHLLHIQPERNYKERVVRLLLSFFKHQHKGRLTEPSFWGQVPRLDKYNSESSIYARSVPDQTSARRCWRWVYLNVGVHNCGGSRLDCSSPGRTARGWLRIVSVLHKSAQLRPRKPSRDVHQDPMARMLDRSWSRGRPRGILTSAVVRWDCFYLDQQDFPAKRVHRLSDRQSGRATRPQPSVQWASNRVRLQVSQPLRRRLETDQSLRQPVLVQRMPIRRDRSLTLISIYLL